jgi:Tfp pilus assembly protein PilO
LTAAARRARFDIREASGKIAIVMGILLAANAVVAVLVVHPKVVAYRKLTDESSPAVREIASRAKAVELREAYAASLVKARDDMKHFVGDVLSTRQRRMIEVQLEIAKLLREFGIAFDRVQYENSTIENGALERFGIVVPLAGGYSNLRKFIQAVESSENFLVIERVDLGSGKTGDSVELNITLATYFIAPNTDLDSILGKKPAPKGRES